MNKLLCLGAVPLLAAFVYGQRDPEPLVPSYHAVETEDRIFLANLDVEESAKRESAARAEQELVAQRLASEPVPVAVAVATPPPLPKVPPIPRAAFVRASSPTAPATSEPMVTLAFGGTSLAHRDLETMPTGEEPEVRRAIPVSQVTPVTQMMPGTDMMPVARAIPVGRAVAAPVASNRGSIGGYQGEVFSFPAYGRR